MSLLQAGTDELGAVSTPRSTRAAQTAVRPDQRLLWTVALLLASVGIVTPNPGLTVASIVALPVFAQLLWRPGEPPLLLMIVLFQWLQVASKVLYADVVGRDVNDLALVPGAPVGRATALGLLALFALACGQALVLRHLPSTGSDRLQREQRLFSSPSLFAVYLTLAVLGQVVEYVGWLVLALSQALLQLALLKWVALFALGNVALGQRRGRGLLAVAVGIEVLLGFGGYFSGFKTVFLVLMLAALSARARVRASQWAAAVTLGVVLFGLVVVWTGIKKDYRSYVSRGEHAQVVAVGRGERLGEAYRMAGALTTDDLAASVEKGVSRLGYVDYFGAALAQVPEVVPHTGGAIWGGAVKHVLTPRFLFPDKAILLSDSELTMQYTGLQLASGDAGTSISLGYVAERYVDFGTHGVWAVALFVGILQGLVYAFFVRRTAVRLIGFGLAIAVLLPAIYFETSAMKYLGGTLSSFLVMGALVTFFPNLILRVFAAATRAR